MLLAMSSHGPSDAVWVTSWHEAEENAARWMRHWGYIDATITQSGADAGIDVRSDRALAQVKFEAHHVGRPALQRLFGARGNRHDLALLFFTGSGYTDQAKQYAQDHAIALLTYQQDGSVTAVNDHARSLSAASPASEPADASITERRGNPGYASIVVGLICVLGLIAGIASGDIWTGTPTDILVSAITAAGLLAAAIFLLRFGVRRLTRSLNDHEPDNDGPR